MVVPSWRHRDGTSNPRAGEEACSLGQAWDSALGLSAARGRAPMRWGWQGWGVAMGGLVVDYRVIVLGASPVFILIPKMSSATLAAPEPGIVRWETESLVQATQRASGQPWLA